MTHQASHRHRLNRVVNFMHAHIQDHLDLASLADVACLSKYHFARTYETRFGETPVRSLRRIRLEYAARRIVHAPEASLGLVAMGAGFDSQASFSRAFSKHFGESPRAFRRPPALSETTFGDDGTPIAMMPAGISNTAVRIERCPPVQLGYIRCMGGYQRNNPVIHGAVTSLREWAKQHEAVNQGKLIGLCHDNRRITPARFCRYDVGFPVGSSTREDDTVGVQTIPAGRYAIATVACRNSELLAVWEWLTFSWRRAVGAPYSQQWSYEVFESDGPFGLDPRKGVDLYLRLSD